ncbi:MAG: hypothetical protein WAT23_07430 [Chromatiaceae bacterium]
MKTKSIFTPAAVALVLAAAVLGPATQAVAADQTTPSPPPTTAQMPMKGGAQGAGGPSGMMQGEPGPMGMMNPRMMQQHWDAMQKHMTAMETHMANVESLLKELVALQKGK